jgi:hypothetical protein
MTVEVFGNRRLSSALWIMLKTAVNKTATHDVLEVKQVQCPKASLESSSHCRGQLIREDLETCTIQ